VRIEIDQSVKIDEIAHDTVLAFSDGVRRAIVIPAAVKREAMAYLWERGKSRKVAGLIVFTAGLFLLLRDVANSITLAIIDREYTGCDALITNRLLQFLWAEGLRVSPDTLAFGYVGKKSKAHNLAVEVHRGKSVPDHRVTLRELLEIL
jgi:hypothetical protein